ncbi:hypothetical protein E4N61_01210 [Salmonella enterica subsp. enterica serovar London]|uniref:hypothetical protein n=1 Tax=Salmonella enterica TaxID=28901 RepID=UPI0012853908|nr:hypothetical protein [Salmonella enterica subsp. enterica serovar London]EEM6498373.1 hypothetical protein [Salmonella enterica]ECD6795865.1 hypothetical protein [Salmonella enterica subsp. enterica serovar London]EEG6823674.1 hypothetical protein [Salmonella enterica subsp. enterica serovar London]EEI4280301.1 hypothetical protein [Salmonella enterica subsp. enterica serovar London]
MNATEKDNVFYCDCGFSWRRGMSGSHNCEDGLRAKLTDMAVQLANAESKCRELAAESAGLKNPENWLLQSDYGYEASEVATQNGATEDESLRAGMIAIINRIGTPATDAFLAEVRAQGVEMAACALDDVNQFNYANMLDELAQKLRKGGAA